MPSLTDDDLDRMLRATFAAHDHLADPDRARHLAATVVDTVGAGGARPRTRRWVAGLAAASVVALGVGAAAVWSDRHTSNAAASSSTTGRSSSSAPVVAQRSAQERARVESLREAGRARNEAVATEVVARLVADAPRPPGARAIPARKGGDDLMTYSTNQVYAERWYAVPGTAEQTLAYLRAHVPAGVTDRETDPQWNDYPVGRLLTLAYVASDNPGHTTPLLDLSVIATGSGQVLYRIQAATSWREANVLSALLQEVIRVDYEIVHLRPSDPTRTGAVTQGTLTDEASIRALTWWLGAAYGQPQYLGHCPYRGEARDSFVLTTAQGGRISVRAELGCPPVVSVTATGGAGDTAWPYAEPLLLADPRGLDAVWRGIAPK
ncbi:MAG: hypothetical protein U0Q21_03015 [Dermatophilaceae bacterium]